MNRVANQKNYKKSLWVNDIIITGSKAKFVAEQSKDIIIKNGLKYHEGKLKTYKSHQSK